MHVVVSHTAASLIMFPFWCNLGLQGTSILGLYETGRWKLVVNGRCFTAAAKLEPEPPQRGSHLPVRRQACTGGRTGGKKGLACTPCVLGKSG